MIYFSGSEITDIKAEKTYELSQSVIEEYPEVGC